MSGRARRAARSSSPPRRRSDCWSSPIVCNRSLTAAGRPRGRARKTPPHPDAPPGGCPPEVALWQRRGPGPSDGPAPPQVHHHLRARLRREQFDFREGLLLPELTAQENVALPLMLSGMGRAEAQDQVAEPLVVFADEPTSALDSTTSEQVLTALLDSITRPPPTADPAWCECRTAGSWPAPTAAPAAPPSPPGAPCELRRNPSRPPPVPGPAVPGPSGLAAARDRLRGGRCARPDRQRRRPVFVLMLLVRGGVSASTPTLRGVLVRP